MDYYIFCINIRSEISIVSSLSFRIMNSPVGLWFTSINYGFSHHYHLDESTFIFRGVRGDFYFFSFVDENE